MFNEILLPDCPGTIRPTAERLLRALNVGKSFGDYNNMTELDKRLTWLYWTEIDGLNHVIRGSDATLEQWFVDLATSPDHISRARRWLVENRYIIVKTSVAEAAQDAGDRWRGAAKGGFIGRG